MDNQLKIWAIYLPAFHRIKENDEWWGKGFTEWDNVRKGKPLFEGHIQPQVPLNNNYYDLSNKEVISKQAELANQYGVDGFICYHYWFSGHKLLEKPCEIILENKEIDFKYSFCWANEPWARTWDGKNTDILMNQSYEDENDWMAHIEYLARFFIDERYIRINDRPVFYIYSACQIPQFDKMIKCWNDYLNSIGIKNIYLVEFISSKNPKAVSDYSDAIMEFQPMYVNRFLISPFFKIKRWFCKKLKTIDFADYDYLWKKIIKNNRVYKNKEVFKGAFTSWDNSPRKGKNSMIVKGSSPQKFEKYLKLLINKKREKTKNNIIVINAWNEWGEGAILEPTEHDKYSYLNAIKKVKESVRE